MPNGQARPPGGPEIAVETFSNWTEPMVDEVVDEILQVPCHPNLPHGLEISSA